MKLKPQADLIKQAIKLASQIFKKLDAKRKETEKRRAVLETYDE